MRNVRWLVTAARDGGGERVETVADQPEVDWPCDLPTSHLPHLALAYDDLGILLGYTEQCHGGTTSPTDPGQPS